ncbi:MAG: hypothetical protein KDA27_18195, partial [Candidatus Eisenbacteria bacterium]|nr:hypothetical protein [Candidatus Eisenbacteria bacterium]
IGGRVRTILTDPSNPNRLLIGSAGGGIWRTANGGVSWIPVDDFLPSLAVTSIVRDAVNPNRLYAATGEGFGNADGLPGAGIFRSDDGGSTWFSLASTVGWRYVNRLAADPDVGNVLFAAVIENGLGRVYRSTNGGTSWVFSVGANPAALDVKIDPNDRNRILVGGDGKVLFSTDGGSSWSEQTVNGAKLPSGGGRCEVTFTSDVSTLYVSMERNGGEIWRTKDGAVTWELRSTGTNYLGNQGWYDNAIWVDPSSTQHLVVGGIDLWRSSDGGATLTKISDWRDYHNPGNSAHADQHTIVPASDYLLTKQVYVGNDGGIQRTTDIFSIGENDWVNLANSLGVTQFYGGASSLDGSLIVGGAQDNDKLRYTGATNGWYQAQTGDGGYAAVDFTNPNVVYGEYVNLSILKSTNGGDSYLPAVNGLGDAGDDALALFIAPFRMDPNDASTLLAGGKSIWRTTDSADNWSSVRGPTSGSPKCSAMEISGAGSHYWVGYDNGRVSRSTDSGASWTDVDANGVGLPNRWVADIAANPSNDNQVFVAFAGYLPDDVWYSADGGTTWENRSGTAPFDLPAVQVNTVVFHPQNPNWVYIGTDLGVLASEDLGLSWNRTSIYSTNEGPAYTEVSDLFFYDDEYLVAVTHGRGMYRSRPLSVVYVDGTVPAGGDGTEFDPFRTIGEAESARGPGATVSVEAGTYPEAAMTFDMRGRYVATGGIVRVQ